MSNQKLSREIVLNSAFEYVDKHGIDQLSMRNLAQTLNVKAMSLYNHVKNKGDVIESITDNLIGLLDFEIALNWQDTIKNRATSLKDLLLKHSWGVLPLMYGFHTGEHITKDFDKSIGILRRVGFTYALCDQIISSINTYVYGYVLSRINFPIEETSYQEIAKTYKDFYPKDKYPYLREMSCEISMGHYSGITNFDLGLSFIIKGIEATINNKGE